MTELSKPRIVCAANRNSISKEIAVGVRHFCHIMRENVWNFCKARGIDAMDLEDPYAMAWRRSEQGFIDQHGNFYTREEAWVIADANNQIINDRSWQTGRLHSEHLY